MNFKCVKCNGKCKASKALNNTLVSANDFGNDANTRGTTQSRVGDAVLVDCQKCVNCGHSFIPTYDIVDVKISNIETSTILGIPIINISLHDKWWNSLADDFSKNSKFQHIHNYLDNNKMIGFSSIEGRMLNTLTDAEICLIWKNMLCLKAYGTPISKTSEVDIDFITKPENHILHL